MSGRAPVCSSSGSSARSRPSVALPTNRAPNSFGVLLVLLLWLSFGDRAPGPSRAAAARGTTVQTPAATIAQNEVAATVGRVLASGEHPSLTWSAIPDVVGELKPLYESEADRLLWFNGTTPGTLLQPALAAIAAAGDRGLDPADYDAAFLAERWASIRAKTATGPELAHFDLGGERRCGPHDQGGPSRTHRSGDDAMGLQHRGEAARRHRRVQEARQGKGSAPCWIPSSRRFALRPRARSCWPSTSGAARRRAGGAPGAAARTEEGGGRKSLGPVCRSSKRGCACSAISRRRLPRAPRPITTRRSSRP